MVVRDDVRRTSGVAGGKTVRPSSFQRTQHTPRPGVQQLQQSIQGMNQAWDRYHQSNVDNANRLDAAMRKYADQGILGQQQRVDPLTDRTYSVGTTHQYHYVNPQGQVQGTNSHQPPN